MENNHHILDVHRGFPEAMPQIPSPHMGTDYSLHRPSSDFTQPRYKTLLANSFLTIYMRSLWRQTTAQQNIYTHAIKMYKTAPKWPIKCLS